MLSFLLNVLSSVYMVLSLVIPAAYMNWILTASCAVTAALLLLFKENRLRLKVDDHVLGTELLLPSDNYGATEK